IPVFNRFCLSVAASAATYTLSLHAALPILIVVVVLLAWWQGRRLGPLVTEPLPVVVRASETVEGRGRLYRSRRARDRAAEALRTDRKSTRLNSSHVKISYAVFCLKKKNT